MMVVDIYNREECPQDIIPEYSNLDEKFIVHYYWAQKSLSMAKNCLCLIQ